MLEERLQKFSGVWDFLLLEMREKVVFDLGLEMYAEYWGVVMLGNVAQMKNTRVRRGSYMGGELN